MNLIQRAQAILLKPRETWPAIADEPATTASIYSEYVVFLAAIPAIASFIGLSIIGAGAFGISYREPIGAGLVRMVLGFAMSLAGVYVMAMIVDAMAPSFSATRNPLNALKLVAYGATAGFVGGVFSLLPMLSWLGFFAGCYSIYLLYAGMPVLMKCPPEKAAGYTAVVVIIAIVAGLVLGTVLGLAMRAVGFGHGGYGGFGSAGNMRVHTADGDVTVDTTALGRVAAHADAARQRMEAAQKSGDAAAQGKALGDMVGALTGAGNTNPVDAQLLKAKLPDALGELKRESFEASGGQAMGIAGSSAKASYAAGDKHVQVSITDLGGVAAMAAMAGWADLNVDKETQDSIEKVYKQDGRTVHEQYRKDGSQGECTVMLQNNLIVEVEGNGVDIAALKAILAGIDLGGLESLKRTAKT